jgi:hypothetical protein
MSILNAVPILPVQPELTANGPKSSLQNDKTAGLQSDGEAPSFISTLRQVNKDDRTHVRDGQVADDEAKAPLAEKGSGPTAEGQIGEAAAESEIPVNPPPTDPKQLVPVDILPHSQTADMKGIIVPFPPAGELSPAPIDFHALAENVDIGETAESAIGTDVSPNYETGRQYHGQIISKPVPPETSVTPSAAPAVQKPVDKTIPIPPPEIRLTAQGEQLLEGADHLQAPRETVEGGLAKPAGDSMVHSETVATLAKTVELAGAAGRKPGQTNTPSSTDLPKSATNTEKNSEGDRPEPAIEASDAEEFLPPRNPATDSPMVSARATRPSRVHGEQRTDWLPPVDRGMQAVNQRATQPPMVETELPSPADAFRENNVSQIVERIAVSVRGNQSEARIALKPDHLGSIRLQISTENNTVSVRIMTEFSMARDLLEFHLPQLKMELQQQGLDVEEFSVTLSEEQHNFRREKRPPQGQAKTGARAKSGDAGAKPDQTTVEPGDRPRRIPRELSSGVDYFA